MGDISKERPDLLANGWTQEMWDARQAMSPLDKAFSTDDSFSKDWAAGKTPWQQARAKNPGMDPRAPPGESVPYTPGQPLGAVNAVRDDAPGAQLDTSAADAERARMSGMLEQLQQQATTGGGAWEQTFKDATQKAGATAQSLGQSTEGLGYQSQLRNIGNAQSAVAQTAVGQENIIRAKEKQSAQTQMSDMLAGMGAQDIDQSIAQAGARQGTRAANSAIQEKSYKDAMDKASKLGGGIMAGLSDGGKVPGQPQVFGDDEKNDTVPAMLSPGEVVIPRSIAHDPEAAADFVRSLNAQKGVQHFAEGGMAPWKPGDIDPTSQQRNEAGEIETKHRNPFGFERSAPTIENGALLDSGQADQSRQANIANDELFATQVAGQGPSVAPQQFQNSNDANIAAAMQSAANNRGAGGQAGAGNAVMLAGQNAQASAGSAAGVMASESSAASNAMARSILAQRERDSALARAQQRAAFANTQMNVGLGLQEQAMLGNMASGASQGVSAIVASSLPKSADGTGRNDSGYDITRDPNARGYMPSEPEDWADPYAGKAFGGEIGDDEDEKRRAREFIDSLGGGA